MDSPVKRSQRPYHAPRRAAAAAQTREAILAAAQARFEAAGGLWARMTHNLRFGLDTATETLLAKPGLRPGLTPEETREILLVAMHWATYRVLTGIGHLDVDAVAAWIKRYYRRMLLA